ncbi:MAG: GDP-mannose 4,6-dehydratase [Mycobacterium sp.]|nr:GDP-mannose 4,6-dehydratase [Mycobacterium sp.]
MRSSSSGNPTALITGVTGQDGYYLSRLLVESGLAVHGVVGRNETAESVEVEGVNAHAIDLMDADAVLDLVTEVSPDYVFHLAGVSSVAMSWKMPVYASQVNAVSTAAVLDACLQAQDRTRRKISVVNASSAEIFAGSTVQRQDEQTSIRPTSPYGASKAFGHIDVPPLSNEGLVRLKRGPFQPRITKKANYFRNAENHCRCGGDSQR